MSSVTVYLALGTNLGDRLGNIQGALEALESQVTLTAISPIYETAAMYVEDQPDFLNLVVAGQTALSPEALLTLVKTLEVELGRTPSKRFGPRLIDIDILFYGDQQLKLTEPDLEIPHPRLHERAFVLFPLADIASSLLYPVTGQTIGDLRSALGHDSGIWKYAG